MKKILIIEDDKIIRGNMTELLEMAGYKIETAANGKEGVEKAQSVQPDLIICDIKMPKLDGYAVLHLLKKEDRTAHIPFIFVTAKGERHDFRKGMEMGADDYLSKPFEDTELYSAVETRLKKSNSTKNESDREHSEYKQFLKEANAFIDFKVLTKGLTKATFKPREIIFRSGDFPHFVFLLKEGQVKTYRMNAEGKELISDIYHKNDFFGYQAIFEDRPYLKNAEALESGSIYKIPKEHFLALLYENKKVAAKLIKIMSKTLTDKEEKLVHMAYDSVRKRVALKLLEIVPDEENNVASISRTDFASLIGTTTETLIRTLTELKNLEIIDANSQTIVLLDKQKLRKLSKSW